MITFIYIIIGILAAIFIGRAMFGYLQMDSDLIGISLAHLVILIIVVMTGWGISIGVSALDAHIDESNKNVAQCIANAPLPTGTAIKIKSFETKFVVTGINCSYNSNTKKHEVISYNALNEFGQNSTLNAGIVVKN